MVPRTTLETPEDAVLSLACDVGLRDDIVLGDANKYRFVWGTEVRARVVRRTAYGIQDTTHSIQHMACTHDTTCIGHWAMLGDHAEHSEAPVGVEHSSGALRRVSTAQEQRWLRASLRRGNSMRCP